MLEKEIVLILKVVLILFYETVKNVYMNEK